MKNRAQVGAKILAATGLMAALLTGCVSESGKVERLPVAGAAPMFTRAVTAVADGDAVKIRFAVDRETDVTVAIRDRQGRVIRRLVSGVLGGNAPEPLKSGSLEQTLVWDGRDEAGRRVAGGAYEVEVALGLVPSAVSTMGWAAGEVGAVHGLALGADGSATIMSEGGYGFPRIQRFSRSGKYERTLTPRSQGLPVNRLAAMGELTLADGQRLPLELMPQYGSDTRQTPLAMPDGSLVFVNGPGRGHPEGHRFRSHERGVSPARRLLSVAPDGGVPAGGYAGPVLGKGFDKGELHLALGPDGRSVYVSGARHAVFKVDWSGSAQPQAVAGTPDEAGSGAKLNDPRGVAVGVSGNIYVADRGNHRVVGFTPEGKQIGQVEVEWPEQIFIDPGTGALYVIAGHGRTRLLKLRGLAGGKPAAEYALNGGRPVAAMRVVDGQPVFLVANVQQPGGGPAVIRLTESSDRFQFDGVVARCDAPIKPFLFGADREQERVYAFIRESCSRGYGRLGGASGVLQPFDLPVHPKANQISEGAVSSGGDVVFHVHRELGRLDSVLRPRPWSASGSFISILPQEDCPRSNYDRGACVAPNGDVYWIFERGGYSKPMRCSVMGSDGTLKKDSLIVFESGSPAGVRVDRRGSVYVLDHLKPIGQLYPEGLKGQAGTHRDDRFVYNYGSVLKFRPEGGMVRKASDREPGVAGKGAFTTAEGRGRFEVDGLEWSWFGVSMIQPALARSEKSPYCCQCWAPRFDLDGHDRLFVPDQLRCAVQVLDSNGNPILRMGSYGNVDDAGIALADPRTVMVTDDAVYVGDMANGRVLRIELGYRTSGRAAVRLSGDGEGMDWVRSQVRLETRKVSPALDRGIEWERLPGRSIDDIRQEVCMAARNVSDWPVGEALAFVDIQLKGSSEKVRAAAVWALWDCPAGREGSIGLLKRALDDSSPLVRVVAATVLLNANDPAGLVEILKAARSDDPDVYKLAETAVLKRVAMWSPENELALAIDRRAPLAPRFPLGAEAVEALIPLLEAKEWYLNRAVLLMLGQSGRPEAAQAILGKLRTGGFKDKNLNRALGALGALRCREAASDMLKYLERGRAANYGTEEYNGDEAEKYAASALARMGEPDSVAGLIELLGSAKPNTAGEALRGLSLMFKPELSADRRIVPEGGSLTEVRVNQMPDPAKTAAAWREFWKGVKGNYASDPDGPGLKLKVK